MSKASRTRWFNRILAIIGFVSDITEGPKCSICEAEMGKEHTLLCTRKGVVNASECE